MGMLFSSPDVPPPPTPAPPPPNPPTMASAAQSASTQGNKAAAAPRQLCARAAEIDDAGRVLDAIAEAAVARPLDLVEPGAQRAIHVQAIAYLEDRSEGASSAGSDRSAHEQSHRT